MPNNHQIDPTEFFAFLEEHDEYPASGQRLAAEARSEGVGPELAEFFEALPTVQDAGQVVEYAVDPNAAPFGESLDLGSSRAIEQGIIPDQPTDGTLEISDIVDSGQ